MFEGLRPVVNLEKFKKDKQKELPKTSVEIEAEDSFHEFVAQILDKKGAYNLAQEVRDKAVSVESYKMNAIEMGKSAERAAEKKEEDFDSTMFLLDKAEKVAEELIARQEAEKKRAA